MAAPEVVLEIATVEHAPLIASRMRQADREEVLASSGMDGETAIRNALAISEFARTAFFDGEAAAIFGVVTSDRFPTIPWLLTTDVVNRFPLTFWKASKAVLATLREAYPDLLQYVDARYAGALSWAKRLGFHVEQVPVPFGRSRMAFHRIALRGG